MRLYSVITFLFALSIFSCEKQEEKKATLPNIIYINIDDLGWKDLACTGSSYYETPNIDSLRRQGMLFTQAYAGAANCAPSRACLLTGLNTPRHGIYTVSNSERGKSSDRKIIPIANTTLLDTGFYTLAELLGESAYVSASMGKWHLGPDPRDQGFDVNVAGYEAGSPKSYFSPYRNPNLEDGPEGEHLNDRLTNEAIKFISEKREKPFFLYLPFYSVHTPLQAKEELKTKFSQRKPGPGQSNSTYAAMIATVDYNIGKLMRTMDSLGISDNSLVIFTSDNGGIRAISSQEPLRAGKGSYYEGGIRVPMIVRWPGRVGANTISSQVVSNLDWFPTFMAIVGKDNEARNVDGINLLPFLTAQKPIENRTLFWHFPIYLQAYSTEKDDGRDPLFRTRPGSVVRSGNWKLHHYYEDNEFELYDLKNDLGERNNLADSLPDKLRELKLRLDQWRERTQAPVPDKINPDYKPVL